MKVTALKAQVRNKDRVSVYVDDAYSFSLDVAQIISLGVKVGLVCSRDELAELKRQGQFGKLYVRALEYVMVRPRSRRELQDYLYRKTRSVKTRTGGEQPGYPVEVADAVFERLVAKGYVDDERFARYWVENRNIRKGSSMRRLRSELRAKGVSSSVIDETFLHSERDETDDIQKVIAKKAARYPERQKLIAYLARQGFSYDVIQDALGVYQETSDDDADSGSV